MEQLLFDRHQLLHQARALCIPESLPMQVATGAQALVIGKHLGIGQVERGMTQGSSLQLLVKRDHNRQVILNPKGYSHPRGRVTQKCPQGGEFGPLTRLDSLHHDGARGAVARNKVLVNKPARGFGAVVVSVAQIHSQHLVAEGAREAIEDELRRDASSGRGLHQHSVSLHVAHVACPLVHLTGKGEVSTGNVAVGCILGVVGIVHHVAVVVHLEHRCPTLRVNHAEVGLDVRGLAQRIEKVAELLHRGTELEGAVDDAAIGLAPLLTGLHLHQVVALRIHQGKACGIGPHPCLLALREVGAVHVGHKVVALALDVSDVVAQVIGIAILPEQRTSVGRHLA